MKMWDELVYRWTIVPRLKRLKKLFPDALIFPAGSRYVCSPPILTTDIDFLVYSDKNLMLCQAGYVSGDFRLYFGANEDQFTTWRKGRVNLILTPSKRYADDFNLATHICKTRNIKMKYQRVLVHEACRGNMERVGMFYNGAVFDRQFVRMLEDFNGQHGYAMRCVYMAQHGIAKV